MNFFEQLFAFFKKPAPAPEIQKTEAPKLDFPAIIGKMRVSEQCLKLIREFEGFSAKPYKCPADVATIGFGSTRYEGGKAVSMSDPEITVARALDLLKVTLWEYEGAVNRLVTVPLKQWQFDALVSLVYNIGPRNFGESTLLKKLNMGNYTAANFEFSRWNKGGGVVLPGLVRRREAESALFMGQI